MDDAETRDGTDEVQPELKKKKRTTKKKNTEEITETVVDSEPVKTTKKRTSVTKKKKKVVEENINTDLQTTELKIAKKKRKNSAIKKANNSLPAPMGQAGIEKIKVEVIAKPREVAINSNVAAESSENFPGTAFKGEKVRIEPLSGTIKTASVQNQVLPVAAVKVRNVTGRVENLTAEIITNKVIVQGIVHEQLFFVGTDGIVHHLSDDIHFSTFLDLPGALPGMNAQVSAIIEEIITELAPDGLSVLKKIILEIFVKITETVQQHLLPGNGPVLLLREVVGENTVQSLIESDVTLFTPAIKIDEITGTIRDLEIEIINDKVIIQGVLHKQIFFIDTANLGRHQAEDVHFSVFTDIPGALPGMDVQVHPRIEALLFNLISPTVVRQKAVLEFFVKVTENVQQQVTIGNGPLFKVEELVGQNNRQELVESLVTLDTPAVKVREIVAQLRELVSHVINNKVIVQGTIHKQIFYIGTDNIERHQAEDIPFSLFLDIPGATPGDIVHLIPRIEAIFFELTSSATIRQKVILVINAMVTREIQLQLVSGEGPLFKLEQVVGENTKQILITRREVLPLPIAVSKVTIVVPTGAAFERQIILNNSLELPETALKIKEVQAIVTGLTARVISNGVIVSGVVEKTVFFVGTDNIVRSVTENIPFTILVNAPGISPSQAVEASVEIENISFSLSASGNTLNQVIVLRATVTGAVDVTEVTVVTGVTGPGITVKTIRVRALVLTPEGAVPMEIDVVTDVSGPGIISVTKQLLVLDVVGVGPTPVEVVTNVQFG